jgi:hypothetical protein
MTLAASVLDASASGSPVKAAFAATTAAFPVQLSLLATIMLSDCR